MSGDYGLAGVHAVLLEMLTDVDALCRRHNLRYSLYCGTLLGAVRDGALIPWDDDADITMPLSDYRAFCQIAREELKDKYVIQDFPDTPGHPWLWMRIYRKDTTYLRRSWLPIKIHKGIAMDVYPLIGVSPTPRGFVRQCYQLRIAQALRHVEVWRATGEAAVSRRRERVMAALMRATPFFIRRALSAWLQKKAMLDPDQCRRCCTVDTAPFRPKYMSAHWREYVDVTLCGRKMRAVSEYHRVLTEMYRDYMTPPPEQERVGHGAIAGGVIIDDKRDYTEYERALKNPAHGTEDAGQ